MYAQKRRPNSAFVFRYPYTKWRIGNMEQDITFDIRGAL